MMMINYYIYDIMQFCGSDTPGEEDLIFLFYDLGFQTKSENIYACSRRFHVIMLA